MDLSLARMAGLRRIEAAFAAGVAVAFALAVSDAHGQATSWDDKSNGQLSDCLGPGPTNCVVFPNNNSWTEDRVIGQHPRDPNPHQTTLRPGNWTTPLYPDNNRGGSWEVTIGQAPPVDLNFGVAVTTLTITGAGALNINGSAVLTVTGGSVQNAGTLDINPSSRLTTGGTLQNSGIMRLGTGGPGARVQLTADTVLEGTGTLTVDAATTAFGFPLSDIVGDGIGPIKRLTHAAGHTIQGGGEIGEGMLALTNRGTITANDPAGRALVIDTATGVTSFNTGLMRAVNGGHLVITGVTGGTLYDNTGGIIRAEGNSPSTLELRAPARITGGTVDVVGGGQILFQGAVLDGVALNNSPTGVIRASGLGAGTTSTVAGDVTNPAGGQIVVDPSQTLKLGGTIRNDGTIHLQGGGLGQNSSLVLSSDVTLNGTGKLTASSVTNAFGFPQNNIVGDTTVAGVERLTNPAGHTIEGGAIQIGQGSLALTNRGLLEVATATNLLVNPNAASSNDNSGTLRSRNGGVLILDGFTLNNTGAVIAALNAGGGGLIEAQNASFVQIRNGATVVGGTLSTQGTGVIQVFGNATLDGLTNMGKVQFSPGASALKNTITNHGTIEVIGTSANLSGDVTLGGTGKVDLRNSGQLGGTLGTERLTNQAGHTIVASTNTLTRIRDLFLTNQGTIDADGNLQILVDLKNDAVKKHFNTGTMKSSNGGNLLIANAPLDNTGGIIEAGHASVVELRSTTIKGGTLRSLGSGFVFQSLGPATLQDLTNEADVRALKIFIQFAGLFPGRIEVIGTLTNNGRVTLDDFSNLFAHGTATLAGNGELVLSKQTGSRVQAAAAGAKLVNEAGHTIRGEGNIGNNSAQFENRGRVLAERVTSSTEQGIVIQPTGTFMNSGTLEARAGSFVFIPGAFGNFAGGTLTDGTYVAHGAAGQRGFIQFGSGLLQTNAANIVLDGPTATIFSLTNESILGLQTNAAAGSLALTSGKALTTNGPSFANAGRVDIGASSALKIGAAGTGNYNQTAGETTVNGLLDVGLASILGGILDGDGEIDGDVLIGAGASLGPGNSPGLLEIDGDYTQAGGGRLHIEIGGPTLGIDHDGLQVAGVARLDGLLDIDFINGFTPRNGEQFKILTFAGCEGAFDDIAVHGLSSNFRVSFSCGSTEALLTTTRLPGQVPAPATLGLLVVGLAGALVARRRRRV